MKKAIILLSGGLDSTTCLALAKSQGFKCYALSFDYGQKHNIELQNAKDLAREFYVEQHEIIQLPFAQFGGCALTDNTIAIDDYKDEQKIPATYVPARNTIFLSIALGWAEILNADAIFIGVSSIDYSGYPDCRVEYIEAYQKMANLATKKGIEGQPVQIVAPLGQLSKAQTIQLGVSLGIDYSKTISCYRANSKKEACGRCDSCVLRHKGFVDARIDDPTLYV